MEEMSFIEMLKRREVEQVIVELLDDINKAINQAREKIAILSANKKG